MPMQESELAKVMHEWFSDPDEESEEETESSAIQQAKQAIMPTLIAARERLGTLFSAADWCTLGETQLTGYLDEWFIAGSPEREGLEDFAENAPDEVQNMLEWLGTVLDEFERGEAIPTINQDFDARGSIPGTEYYKLSSGQWLYGPSREGSDWAAMEDRQAAVVSPASASSGTQAETQAPVAAAAVDLSTPEQAQEAAVDVAAAAQSILSNVMARAPEAAADIGEERLKQLALEVLKVAEPS
ncbi:MAG: hypothetical protein ACRD3O_17610 [Terriglobia bacterium]